MLVGAGSQRARGASRIPEEEESGDTTPCRMTGVTLHGVVSPEEGDLPDQVHLPGTVHAKNVYQGRIAVFVQGAPVYGVCILIWRGIWCLYTLMERKRSKRDTGG